MYCLLLNGSWGIVNRSELLLAELKFTLDSTLNALISPFVELNSCMWVVSMEADRIKQLYVGSFNGS